MFGDFQDRTPRRMEQQLIAQSEKRVVNTSSSAVAVASGGSAYHFPGLPPLPALPPLPPLPGAPVWDSNRTASVGATQSGGGAPQQQQMPSARRGSGSTTTTAFAAVSSTNLNAASTSSASSSRPVAAPSKAAEWSPHNISPDSTPERDRVAAPAAGAAPSGATGTGVDGRASTSSAGSGAADALIAGFESSRTPSPLHEPSDSPLPVLAASTAQPTASTAAPAASTSAGTNPTTGTTAATAVPNQDAAARDSPLPPDSPPTPRSPPAEPIVVAARTGTTSGGTTGSGSLTTGAGLSGSLTTGAPAPRSYSNAAAAAAAANAKRDLANISLTGLSCDDVHTLVDELLNSTRDMLESADVRSGIDHRFDANRTQREGRTRTAPAAKSGGAGVERPASPPLFTTDSMPAVSSGGRAAEEPNTTTAGGVAQQMRAERALEREWLFSTTMEREWEREWKNQRTAGRSASRNAMNNSDMKHRSGSARDNSSDSDMDEASAKRRWMAEKRASFDETERILAEAEARIKQREAAAAAAVAAPNANGPAPAPVPAPASAAAQTASDRATSGPFASSSGATYSYRGLGDSAFVPTTGAEAEQLSASGRVLRTETREQLLKSAYDPTLATAAPDGDSATVSSAVPLTMRKTTTKTVAVPFVRSVPVETPDARLVETTQPKRIRVKKFVNLPTEEVVHEPYVQVVENPHYRSPAPGSGNGSGSSGGERWLKVYGTRPVKRVTNVWREVDDWTTINVPYQQLVATTAVKMQSVADQKIVQFQESQDFELIPKAIGSRQQRSRELDAAEVDRPRHIPPSSAPTDDADFKTVHVPSQQPQQQPQPQLQAQPQSYRIAAADAKSSQFQPQPQVQAQVQPQPAVAAPVRPAEYEPERASTPPATAVSDAPLPNAADVLLVDDGQPKSPLRRRVPVPTTLDARAEDAKSATATTNALPNAADVLPVSAPASKVSVESASEDDANDAEPTRRPATANPSNGTQLAWVEPAADNGGAAAYDDGEDDGDDDDEDGNGANRSIARDRLPTARGRDQTDPAQYTERPATAGSAGSDGSRNGAVVRKAKGGVEVSIDFGPKHRAPPPGMKLSAGHGFDSTGDDADESSEPVARRNPPPQQQQSQRPRTASGGQRRGPAPASSAASSKRVTVQTAQPHVHTGSNRGPTHPNDRKPQAHCARANHHHADKKHASKKAAAAQRQPAGGDNKAAGAARPKTARGRSPPPAARCGLRLPLREEEKYASGSGGSDDDLSDPEQAKNVRSAPARHRSSLAPVASRQYYQAGSGLPNNASTQPPQRPASAASSSASAGAVRTAKSKSPVRYYHSSHAVNDPPLPGLTTTKAQVPYAYPAYPYYTPASVPVVPNGSGSGSSVGLTRGPAPPSPPRRSGREHTTSGAANASVEALSAAIRDASGHSAMGYHDHKYISANGNGNHSHGNGAAAAPASTPASASSVTVGTSAGTKQQKPADASHALPPPIPSAHGTLVDGGAARRPVVRLLQAMNLLDRLGLQLTTHAFGVCNSGCQNYSLHDTPASSAGSATAAVEASGLLIEALTPGGVAERSGAQIEDVIIRVNERPVWSIEQFLVALKRAVPYSERASDGSRRVTLEVKRGLQTRFIQMDVQKFIDHDSVEPAIVLSC